jgi:hypothetical protein
MKKTYATPMSAACGDVARTTLSCTPNIAPESPVSKPLMAGASGHYL